ncbi:OLC1v1008397C1 [Oldenlandia corymbosa var. corymbosa]|uniref:OLC1v1008397C1 n=1 Tax=Oldenlandia corymbosa var. corymbosa TaxID=529605 RepID=A0AAV1DLI2_OLDCO|nr:OLC1v1008397C1 [Oldenlandia corymbosa var. corymbosa]
MIHCLLVSIWIHGMMRVFGSNVATIGYINTISGARDEFNSLFPPYMRTTDGQINKKMTRLSPEYITKHFYVFQGLREEDIMDGFVYSHHEENLEAEQEAFEMNKEVIRLQRRCSMRENNGSPMEGPSHQLSRPWGPQEGVNENQMRRAQAERLREDDGRLEILSPPKDWSSGGTTRQQMGEWIFSQKRARPENRHLDSKSAHYQTLTIEEVMEQLTSHYYQRVPNRESSPFWRSWMDVQVGQSESNRVWAQGKTIRGPENRFIASCPFLPLPSIDSLESYNPSELRQMCIMSDDDFERRENIRLGKRPVREDKAQGLLKKQRREERLWDETGKHQSKLVMILEPPSRVTDIHRRPDQGMGVRDESNSSVNNVSKHPRYGVDLPYPTRGYGKDINLLIDSLGKAMEDRNRMTVDAPNAFPVTDSSSKD